MFGLIFNKDQFTKKLAKEIVKETDTVLQNHGDTALKEFNEIKEILAHLNDKIGSLESRLMQKELKDNSDYGHLQYKLGELQTNLKKFN